MTEKYNMKFNINTSDHYTMNLFVDELRNVKQLMETEGTNFYLNVRFSKDEAETLDLDKCATIHIARDGFAVYSLATHSSSFIFYKSIVGLELVEV